MRKIRFISLLSIIFIILSFNTIYAKSLEIDFSEIFENHGLVGLIVDAQSGSIEYANKAAIEFYGYPKEQLLNMTIQQINILDGEKIESQIKKVVEKECNYFIFKHQLASGEIKNVEVHAYPVMQGGKQLIYSVVIDITSKVLLEKSLEDNNKIILYLTIGISILFFSALVVFYLGKEKYKNLAIYDPLTGAYSRLYLTEFSEKFQNELSKKSSRFWLVEIDLDKFKSINDCYGHGVGDNVLKKVVETSKAYIRKGDFVIRYGGDEFIFILKNCEKEQVVAIVNRVQDKLKNNTVFEFPIEFSYGIQELNSDEDIYDAIKLADEKMYVSKTNK